MILLRLWKLTLKDHYTFYTFFFNDMSRLTIQHNTWSLAKVKECRVCLLAAVPMTWPSGLPYLIKHTEPAEKGLTLYLGLAVQLQLEIYKVWPA